MKRIATGVFAAAAAVIMALPAQAQPYPYSINITVTPPTYSGCLEASVADQALSCAGLNPNGVDVGPFNPNFAWVLVGGVPEAQGEAGGIGGLQFGVEFDPGIIISSWALCTGGSEIPQQEPVVWPANGSGNAMTWPDACYLVTANGDGLTRVGFFAINPGADGFLNIIEDPRTGKAEATDCQTTLFRVCKQLLGSAEMTIGGTGGENTCGNFCPVPVRETSWGGIKSAYN